MSEEPDLSRAPLPGERAVQRLTPEALAWLEGARRAAEALRAGADPGEPGWAPPSGAPSAAGEAGPADRAAARLSALARAAQRSLPPAPEPARLDELVGILGVALGDVLVERHGLAWVEAEGEGAGPAALALALPGTTLRVNPLSTVARNLKADGSLQLGAVLESLSTVLVGGAVALASPSTVPLPVPVPAPGGDGGPAVPERPVVLALRGVAKAYRVGGSRLDVLRGVDLDVRSGEILAILGKSGCGKSTLLHVLGWLDRADAGEIRYDGVDRNALPARERARQRNRVMGFVFQFYHLMPELTALENVLLPALIQHDRRAWRAHEHACRERARALLAMVGLGERMHHRPRQLSGGERQRVAIARALQNSPRFLLCDEPTGNLDGRTAEDVRALLWGLNRTHGQTMVIVTHDARLAAEAHRTIHLVEGRVVEGRVVEGGPGR